MTATTYPPPPPVDSYPYDLGTYSFPISTTSSSAQTWFDRGLIWSHAFHHIASVQCFKHAAATDPQAAMPYWGIAYARGVNYNLPGENLDSSELVAVLAECHAAAAQAVSLARDPVEKALAEAILARYPEPTYGAASADTAKHTALEEWNKAYVTGMERAYEAFPDNMDVACIYADALMSLAPWKLWDIATGKPSEVSRTAEIQEVLERQLGSPSAPSEAAKRHPGVLHFYIHLMELSPWPERALPAADALRQLVPDGGHLRHMPSHIDILTGDYRRAISANLDAFAADEKYLKHGSAADFYAFYWSHDLSFVTYASMFNGQYATAISSVERLESLLTDDFLRIESPPMMDWMEGFLTFRVHVLVRFGKWDEILATPFPQDKAFYCVTTAFLHYGRALALTLTDRVEEGKAERELFRESRKQVLPSRQAFPNEWSDILDIAEEMLSGELAYRQGDVEAAFEHLRKSIKLSDNLVYAEPWGWMQPPRHAYAALQLEQGNVDEAARVYAEDLGFSTALPRAVRHPNNIWALVGYHDCLVRLGRTAEADMLEPQLAIARAVADVDVRVSCYCAKVPREVQGGEEGKVCCK